MLISQKNSTDMEERIISGNEAISGGILALIIAIISGIIALCAKLLGGDNGGAGGGNSKNSSASNKISNLAVNPTCQRLLDELRDVDISKISVDDFIKKVDKALGTDTPSQNHFSKKFFNYKAEYASAASLDDLIKFETKLISFQNVLFNYFENFLKDIDLDAILKIMNDTTELKKVINEEQSKLEKADEQWDNLLKNIPVDLEAIMSANKQAFIPIKIKSAENIKLVSFNELFKDDKYINTLLSQGIVSSANRNIQDKEKGFKVLDGIGSKIKSIQRVLKSENKNSGNNTGKDFWTKYGKCYTRWFVLIKSIQSCLKWTAKYIPTESDLKFELKYIQQAKKVDEKESGNESLNLQKKEHINDLNFQRHRVVLKNLIQKENK